MHPLPKPKRVLMTTDNIGGVWTYALELARAFGPREIHIDLAVLGRPLTTEQYREVAELANVTVFELPCKLEWMQEPWEDVRASGQALLELESRLKPDVIHLNGYAHGALPWTAPTIVVGHSCVLSWWRAVHGEEAPAQWDAYREAVIAGVQASNLVIAPSAAMLASLDRYYGPLGASRVIPNGRSHAQLRPRPKQPFILTAGRLWDQAKNSATLAGLAAKLAWPVYLAGEEETPEARQDHSARRNRRCAGSSSMRVRALLRVSGWSRCRQASGWLQHSNGRRARPTRRFGGALGSQRLAAPRPRADVSSAELGAWPDNLRRLGRLSRAALAPWFGRASIYALPARYEPFGLSVLEAALSGCALVLGDIESLRENWDEAAVFVPPNDAAALKATLNELIVKPSLRAEWGAKARARAARFTSECMAEEYLRAYGEVLRDRRLAETTK